MRKNPRESGYVMPAEWEPHDSTWISWPKDTETFPGGILAKVEAAFVQMAKALVSGEKVNILVNDRRFEDHVMERLIAGNVFGKNVHFHRIKSVDVWTRDYAPTFIKNNKGKVAAVKWIFNSWGNKYDELKKDDDAGKKIAEVSGVEIFTPGIVLEGGSIEANGKGIVLTTKQCLLNKNRNPHLSKAQIEKCLLDYIGAKKIIWLKDGIEGDDTDGHIDDIARFVNDDTVLCAFEENKNDTNYVRLMENVEILEKAGLNVVKLPMPREVIVLGRRVPASYANFYIGNAAVLVPVFGAGNEDRDELALNIIRKCFPTRRVIGINCREYVYGFGAIHCSTQQQPK